MTEFIEMTLRSVVAISALFASTKVMGRRELAEMSMFDYILGISIGAIGAELAINLEEDWYDYVVVMGIFVGLHQISTFLTMKNTWARKFFEGAPVILMQDGKIIEKNLRRVQYDINTLLEDCRLEGYFDITDVDTAIMESTGTISFIPKEQDETKQIQIPANLIIEGRIIRHALEGIGKDEAWLREKLHQENIEMSEVLLASYNKKRGLKIHERTRDITVKHIIE